MSNKSEDCCTYRTEKRTDFYKESRFLDSFITEVEMDLGSELKDAKNHHYEAEELRLRLYRKIEDLIRNETNQFFQELGVNRQIHRLYPEEFFTTYTCIPSNPK